MNSPEHEVVFVYRREDGPAAYALASALSDAGLRIWFDQWEVIPGQPGDDEWQHAIATSGIILVCLGAADLGADPMYRLALARAKKDRSILLLPIQLGDVRSQALPPELASWQPVALGDDAGPTQSVLTVCTAILERIVSAGQDSNSAQRLTALNNVAEGLRAADQLDSARALHEKVLNARQRVLGTDHPDTLASMNNLAGTLFAQGQHARAQAVLEEAVSISRSTLEANQAAGGLPQFVERTVETGRRLFGKEPAASSATTVEELIPTLQGNLYGAMSAQGKLVRRDRRKALVGMAEEILRGKPASPPQSLSLSLELRRVRAFGHARRLLALALKTAGASASSVLRLRLIQQLALCTYKDPDLPIEMRLDRALNLLDGADELANTNNPELLGLAGAIHKRKWDADGQPLHLERAYQYYRRGYERGVTTDFGYNAINTAFILDLLASLEAAEAKKAGGSADAAGGKRAEARRVRGEVVAELLPLAGRPGYEWLTREWWYYATLGEAYFGLQEYDSAIEWLLRRRPRDLDVPEWDYESGVRQLAELAAIQSDVAIDDPTFPSTPAWAALNVLLGDDAIAVRSAFAGKVGLALSGGGFRGSFFHIGVLARLAELDVLRHVEVLSCVSGGSIVGAHYYLELRRLLHTKGDRDITREDYVDIVRRLEREFLAGVQRNLRARVTASLFTNLKMLFVPHHSRALRAGELLEREVFARVEDGEGDRPRWLDEMTIRPLGTAENFMPQYDNWRRAAKVPILIVNATTVNTGHNWQFTTTWMGESPAYIATDLDTNDRLRRMYYEEAPPRHRRMRLGYAVAASASVPGVFEPLALAGLYLDRIVQLMDGGFRDAQGTMSLLENDCNVVLSSDATGTITSQRGPSGFLDTFVRGSECLVSGLREAKYQELLARRRAGTLRAFTYLHLRKDLGIRTINFIGGGDRVDDIEEGLQSEGRLFTKYGILRSVQERLAGIRADFDSYTEAEAYALMTSGYRMTAFEFSASATGLPRSEAVSQPWRFLSIDGLMSNQADCAHEEFMAVLRAGGSRFFKAWALSPWLRASGSVIALATVALVMMSAWSRRVEGDPLVVAILIALAMVVAAGGFIARFSTRAAMDAVFDVFLIFIGIPAAYVRLLVTDRIYLRRGSLERLLRRSRSSKQPGVERKNNTAAPGV